MEQNDAVGIRAHGVELLLSCDSPELLEHVTQWVPSLVRSPGDAPDLEVHATWITEARERGRSWFSGSTVGALGKRMQVAPDELVWSRAHRDRDLQLRFKQRAGRPAFEVAYLYRPSRKKLAQYPDLRQKKFYDLLRYLVHFPLAWHLERTRGWALLHASAVARGDRAALLAGPGGAGKTTTCLALAARSGSALLTENLLLCDGEEIHAVEEPIRLTEESLALLAGALDRLKPVPLESGLKHKRMFQLPQARTGRPARAAAIFLPRFAEHGFVRRLEPGVACELLEATNRLTLELCDYYWYAAALDLLWPRPGTARGRLAVLERLTAATPCFELGIDRSAGVEPVVEHVLSCLDAETEAGDR